MRKIYERLYIGDETDCNTKDENWVIVHACKSPCHQSAVGYKGSLPSTHPNYLILEKHGNLYLNMIDPPQPLFMPPLFIEFLRFSRKNWNAGKTILIHCNKGESRAPTLGLLFLAKVVHSISNDSYETVKQQYLMIDPFYSPGNGIQIYLTKNWRNFDQINSY